MFFTNTVYWRFYQILIRLLQRHYITFSGQNRYNCKNLSRLYKSRYLQLSTYTRSLGGLNTDTLTTGCTEVISCLPAGLSNVLFNTQKLPLDIPKNQMKDENRPAGEYASVSFILISFWTPRQKFYDVVTLTSSSTCAG